MQERSNGLLFKYGHSMKGLSLQLYARKDMRNSCPCALSDGDGQTESNSITQPLFPGYVFCRFNVQERLPILVTSGVLFIVGVGKVPCPIDNSEIVALQSIVRSGLPAQPWPFLKAGQRVRIEQGSLEGIEGILLSAKSPYRLVVSVSLLQRSVAVEVDRDWVTPISSQLQLRSSPSYSFAPKPVSY